MILGAIKGQEGEAQPSQYPRQLEEFVPDKRGSWESGGVHAVCVWSCLSPPISAD